MQESQFRGYLEQQENAPSTISIRVNALKRIEKLQGVDLDKEFERDELRSLADLLKYSADDERLRRANPTHLNIDPDRLRYHLAWYRSHLQSYRRFKSNSSDLADTPTEDVDASTAESVGQIFALERDMQAALRANLEQLEAGLVAIDGGTEKRVEAGSIDILARDRQGTPTIIELKADVGKSGVIAQILSYMGCIAESEGRPVRGIIVAADYDKRVQLAVRAIPNLTLKRYRFRFEFE